MFETLWYIFKVVLVIWGILIAVSFIYDWISRPLKKKKKEKEIQELIDTMQKCIEDALMELEKEKKDKENTPKTKRKYTKRTNKNKEN